MDFRIIPIIPSFVFFLLLFSTLFPSISASQFDDFRRLNQTFRPGEESKKMRLIRSHLMKINKPSVKTIQSPDGDIMDCVMVHQQPAFDHPELKGTKPLDPPERPNGYHHSHSEHYQLWSLSGESCPEGTIPIRRTTEQDVLRASNIKRFGRKLAKLDSSDSFERLNEAIGYVTGEQYYGAKAIINVWNPNVTDDYDISLSQVWVFAGLDADDDANTVEAGWQVYPELYGDDLPRLFTYWTADGYQSTGCYNLLCSGFVQTNNEIALGAAIFPTSLYNGGQFDISVLIWKDPNGNWWLQFGSGLAVGYWPASLFTHLRDHATMVQFGGDVFSSQDSGSHTSTEMGSGHFPSEGFGKASYFRNMQVVDSYNLLVPLSKLNVVAYNPNCYDISGGISDDLGNYIFYGGPGKNPNCP